MFSERLKQLRKEKNITQEELAKLLGVERSTVGKWESKMSIIPPADMLITISDLFNVTIDYLLGKSAFRNPMELFEHWGGNNDIYFESPFDFGGLLKEVREKQGITLEDVSKALNITTSDVEDIEDGILPLNYDWAEKYATFLGTSVTEIFIENGMSDSFNDIPLELLHHYKNLGMSEKEMVTAYTTYKNDIYEDATQKPNIEEPTTEIHTIAAHHDGDEWTEEELEDIENFKKYVLSKRNKK